MFKVQNRKQTPMVNLIAKRMAMAVIKRSHEICTDTVN
jgi:hypothetical protein